MSQSVPSSSRNTLWRGKNLGLTEFTSLLNLMPGPALLLDRARAMVLLSNSAALKLTSFSQIEINGRLIEDLLSDHNSTPFEPGEQRDVLLVRRNRTPVAVHISAYALDPMGQWLLLMIDPKDQQEYSDKDDDEVLADVLNFKALFEIEDVSVLFNTTLNLAKELFGTDYACIYQAQSDYPQLVKCASIEPKDVFPEVLSETDFYRLAVTTVWKPGKQVFTEVHRAGRVAKMAYVASTALGHEGALLGILVIGDPEKSEKPKLSHLLDYLGNLASHALQRLILIEHLRSENERYENTLAIRGSLVENSQEGILVAGPDLKIIEMNSAAELMLDYTDLEVRMQPVENVLIGPERLLPALQNATKGVPTHNMGNVSLHRRTGVSFPAHIQVIPVLKADSLLAILIFINDVSEHEQIRLRTQQLEHRAVLGEFTAIFAHEVRNPINNISTGLQLLSSRISDDDPHQDAINRMQSDCTRLNHLMESVLAFARPLEPRFEPMDVGILMKKILDRWRPRLARVNINSFYQESEPGLQVMGDPRSLEQVFTNLISNAVEAMSQKGGTLAVRITKSEFIANLPQVEVSVSDNGPGIPDEIREHIFEPFITSKSGGTGLGLAITKRIVIAHQGSITVNSFPGGTVFHVYLPTPHGE
jgi:two-component system sensor histidine kinase AtoS